MWWQTPCLVAPIQPLRPDKTSRGMGAKKEKHRSRSKLLKNFGRVDRLWWCEYFWCDFPEDPTARVCPFERFKFWTELTPEEREALTRERRGLRPEERLPRPEATLSEGEGHSSFEEVDESGETPAPPRPATPWIPSSSPPTGNWIHCNRLYFSQKLFSKFGKIAMIPMRCGLTRYSLSKPNCTKGENTRKSR